MHTNSNYSHLMLDVVHIARETGGIIRNFYHTNSFQSFTKTDDTPVTSADIAAHQHILTQLNLLTPHIPILSEESDKISFQERRDWSEYWLVDPLDGTQEFIQRSGDFATVIALMVAHQPVMGVVYAPMSDVIYYAYKHQGAWKMIGQNEPMQIQSLHHETHFSSLSIVMSRRQKIQSLSSHLSDQWHYDLIPLGSAALKACLVAEGGADCYLRIGPTGEWDTAATQCIVEEAGGSILDMQLTPLSYNERESLTNPNFIVIGDPHLPWDDILQP